MLQQALFENLSHQFEGAWSWSAGEQLHAGASAGVTLRMDSQKSSKEGQVGMCATQSSSLCVGVRDPLRTELSGARASSNS